MRLSRVVLPAPLGPSSAQFSPRFTVQSRLSRMVISSNRMVTPFISTRISGASAPGLSPGAGIGARLSSSSTIRCHPEITSSRLPWRTTRPSFTHRTWPIAAGISSARWLTRTSWTPSLVSSSNRTLSSSREAASIPPKGSSRTRSRGDFIRARAMSTLRSSPVERWRIGLF